MNRVQAVYIVILFLDLLVGCSLIVWKCTESSAEVGCQLAIGGTITSIAVWLLLMLVCPCFTIQHSFCTKLHNIRKKVASYFEKRDQWKKGTSYMQNEIYLPTTTSLLDIEQEGTASNGEDTGKLLGIEA